MYAALGNSSNNCLARLRASERDRRKVARNIPVALRGDFKASQVRALARKTKDGPQARRLLAIYDGTTRTEAAKIGGVTLQIIRDW
jgi:hypothetical protein